MSTDGKDRFMSWWSFTTGLLIATLLDYEWHAALACSAVIGGLEILGHLRAKRRARA